MKKSLTALGAVVIILLASFIGINMVAAQSFHSGDTVTVKQDEPIDATVFAAGNNVFIDSDVNGDVICAGQTVKINGTIHGDVICAGQTVTVSGRVDGDIRLAGQTINIGARVGKNATLAGQTIALEPSGAINGDIAAMGNDVTLGGRVGRDIAVKSSRLLITGDVGRNISADVHKLELAGGATIDGNVNYTSSNTLSRAGDVTVNGEVKQNQPAKGDQPEAGDVAGFIFGMFLYWLLALLIIAMAIALLFPRVLHSVTNRAFPYPWWALLTGFIASVIMPFIVILLALTFVGLPLALIIGVGWLLIFLLSGPFFAYYLGRLVLRNSTKPLLIMLLGAVLLIVLYFIPFLNAIVLAAAVWIGSGMILLEMFWRTPRPAYELANQRVAQPAAVTEPAVQSKPATKRKKK